MAWTWIAVNGKFMFCLVLIIDCVSPLRGQGTHHLTDRKLLVVKELLSMSMGKYRPRNVHSMVMLVLLSLFTLF